MPDVEQVTKAFSSQSSKFDHIEEANDILKWMRMRIHMHCMEFYNPGESILELNCGTGIDAVFFAENGMHVHATDISEGMLDQLRKKIGVKGLLKQISVQQLSFLELSRMGERKFNHIFSDFGGLNCTGDLIKVISQFEQLLFPGGTVTLVLMPPVCPWEMMLGLKGNFKTAFRRLKKKSMSHLEGEYFMTYYYSPKEVIRMFDNRFEVKKLAGLGSLVPPPYLDNFPRHYPKLFKRLCKLEQKVSVVFPFNRWADHFILTLKLK